MKRSKKIKIEKKKKSRKFIIVSLIIITLASVAFSYIYFKDNKHSTKKVPTYQENYIAGATNDIDICTLVTEEDIDKLVCDTKITRGTTVLNTKKTYTYEDTIYTNIIVNNKKYYVMNDNLTTNKENIITEKTLYTRTATSIINNIDDIKVNKITK